MNKNDIFQHYKLSNQIIKFTDFVGRKNHDANINTSFRDEKQFDKVSLKVFGKAIFNYGDGYAV